MTTPNSMVKKKKKKNASQIQWPTNFGMDVNVFLVAIHELVSFGKSLGGGDGIKGLAPPIYHPWCHPRGLRSSP